MLNVGDDILKEISFFNVGKINPGNFEVMLSSDAVYKMKYLLKDKFCYSMPTVSNELKGGVFFDLFEEIVRKNDYVFQDEYINNKINYNFDLINSLKEKYNKLSEELIVVEGEELFLHVGYGEGFTDKLAEYLAEYLDVMYNLKIEIRNYWLTCGLIEAKEDALLDMKYFADADTISQFDEEFEKAIREGNIEKMRDMLKDVQQNILKEWDKYLVDLDLMSDDKFAFLGHSTRAHRFEGGFHSRYVSTSLFTQDLNFTFGNQNCGFILSPKKIVGADSRDMYVNNRAENVENLLPGNSIVARIFSPQRIIDECLKLKQKNQNDGNTKGVYSEIVIDGFEPIGLFCFTDGSKNLDLNYQHVHKMQESFPDLKIYSFDIMKRKKGTELKEMKLKLLESLWGNSIEGKNAIADYDYFFEKFEKLKQDSNYNEDDIEAIFKRNSEFLSSSLSEDLLFGGEYNDEEIKYILGKNPMYNIESILGGSTTKYALNSLKKLFPYKDRLNHFYDGLGEFVDLVSRFGVTDEIVSKINESNSKNFYIISKILADELRKPRKEQLNKFQLQYSDLSGEIQRRTKIEEQYDYYYSIQENSWAAESIKKDYSDVISEINNNKEKEDRFQLILIEIISQLNEVNEKINMLESSNYDGEDEHIDYEEQLGIIETELSLLSKHYFLNWKKIREKKRNLREIKSKDEKGRLEFDVLMGSKKEELILEREKLISRKKGIESDLDDVQLDKVNLSQQLETLKAKIKDYFKCDSIEEISSIVLEAKEFMDNYDGHNKDELARLKEELEELNVRISEQKNELDSISEERVLISKGK